MLASLHLLTEDTQSFPTAAREIKPIRAGKPVHATALWRWARFGVKTPAGMIKLETVHLAGRLVTSRQAVQRFLRRVAEAKAGLPISTVKQEAGQGVATPGHTEAKAMLDQCRF